MTVNLFTQASITKKKALDDLIPMLREWLGLPDEVNIGEDVDLQVFESGTGVLHVRVGAVLTPEQVRTLQQASQEG